MKIRIGKSEDNDFVVRDPQVSRYHAVLTRDDVTGKLMIEDLGSTNGTFVNDIQIAKKHITSKDIVTFGTNSKVLVRDIIRSDNDYSEEFASLKPIYDTYIKEKIRIQSSNQFKTRLIQSMPFALIGIIGVFHSLKGNLNEFWFIVSLVLIVCAPTAGIYLGARQAAKIPAKLQALANKFKIDYVCPKCGTFLGEIPWESLKNKRQCPISSCKAKWVKN